MTGTTSSADIVYEDSDGFYYEMDGEILPWSAEFMVYSGPDPDPDFNVELYLSAQNLEGRGMMTVNIYYKRNPGNGYIPYQSSSDFDLAEASGYIF